MNLAMDTSLATAYKSRCQIARVVSEDWASSNLYCACCDSRHLKRTPQNTRAVDLICSKCSAAYQLKSSTTWREHRVPDAGYDAMLAAIRGDRTPNLLVLQYSVRWSVTNLLLIPSFFFTETAIQKRPPLSPTARRAGWVGCNILLSAIAQDGKIRVVADGKCTDACEVRRRYAAAASLAHVKPQSRGWTLDVLRVVRSLNRTDFALADVYCAKEELSQLYPSNRNIKPKIRQQLQTLRDLGFVQFLGRGRYRLRHLTAE